MEYSIGFPIQVTELRYATANEDANEAAGAWITEHCDQLIVVWDGHPARGKGGNADVVARARQLGRSVRVVRPPGAEREL